MRRSVVVTGAALAVAAEQLLKHAARFFSPVIQLGPVSISYTPNHSYIYSGRYSQNISIIVFIGLLAVLYYLITTTKASKPVLVGLLLIISGAASNLLDKIFSGFVIDYLLLHDFFFNMADVAILSGALVIFVDILIPDYKRKLAADINQEID